MPIVEMRMPPENGCDYGEMFAFILKETGQDAVDVLKAINFLLKKKVVTTALDPTCPTGLRILPGPMFRKRVHPGEEGRRCPASPN